MAQSTGLPSLDQALKDLETYEKKYQTSIRKLQNVETEVEKLKIAKQTLQLASNENKDTIAHMQEALLTTTAKTANAILAQNRAQLAGATNTYKMKQTEAVVQANTLQFKDFDVNVSSLEKLKSQKEEFAAEEVALEKEVEINNIRTAELRKKLDPSLLKL